MSHSSDLSSPPSTLTLTPNPTPRSKSKKKKYSTTATPTRKPTYPRPIPSHFQQVSPPPIRLVINKRRAMTTKSFKPLRKPTRQESIALLNKFGASSHRRFVFKPRQENAHIDPWVFLDRKAAGAAGRSMSTEVVLKRIRGNVETANVKVADVAQIMGKGGLAGPEGAGEEDLPDCVEALRTIYETYFNRRKVLLKELEFWRAKSVVAREG